MPIKFPCMSCKKILNVADSSAGKKGKCPKCGSLNIIPSSSMAKNARAPVAESKSKPKKTSAPTLKKSKSSKAPALPKPIPVAAPELPSSIQQQPSPFEEINFEPPPVAARPEPLNPLTQSPYATPQANGGQQNHVSSRGNGVLQQIFMPLRNNLFYVKAASWFLLIYGGLMAITIVGIIIAWLPIWMGITLRQTAAGIENGYATGNSQEFASATKNLSTYFAILGVLSMIWLVLISIYVVIIVIAIGVGAVGALSAR